MKNQKAWCPNNDIVQNISTGNNHQRSYDHFMRGKSRLFPYQLNRSSPLHRSFSSDATLPNLLQGRVQRHHLLQIHARIIRLNAHQNDLIATRIIGHYPPHTALKVFGTLQNPNIFPFNALIRVMSESGGSSNAFFTFRDLKRRGLSPNDLTFSFLFKACWTGNGFERECVEQLHCDAVKMGFASDAFVCNGLIRIYTKGVGDLNSARSVFDEMPDRSFICCWTSLIEGYAKGGGLAAEALRLFVMMMRENLSPESDTMVSVLSACSGIGTRDVLKWVDVLSRLVQDLEPSCSDSVRIVLIYLYGKCGKVAKSREVFDTISDVGKRSVLAWNAMIGAYVQNGHALEALGAFKLMTGIYLCRPNHVSMVSVLSACAEVGDLDLGMWVHEYMRIEGNKGVLSSNVNLATALIDMYCKCGNLDKAMQVFDQMNKKDVISFNAMIMGLAVNGKGGEALKLFSKMQEFSLRPNSGTLLGALSACCHSGLLQPGREIFNWMTRLYSITPTLEHYACYVDLLARSGSVEEALGVATTMPFEPNNFVWGALLSGCVLHHKLELARIISTMLVKVDPENSAGYVMLSNSFAADNKWRNVSKLRGSMREKGVTKKPGRSWINVEGTVHEFLAGSASNLRIGNAHHQMIDSLIKEMKVSYYS